MLVNGWSFPARPNLWGLLHAFRLRKETCPLWIDAVCVNQNKSNPLEKDEQIPMMVDIYRMAKEVYIWLGPSADDSDFVTENINNGYEEAYTTARFAIGFLALVRRPWWGRTWIVQEFIINEKSPEIFCGQAPSVSSKLFMSVCMRHAVRATALRVSLASDALECFTSIGCPQCARNAKTMLLTPSIPISCWNSHFWCSEAPTLQSQETESMQHSV